MSAEAVPEFDVVLWGYDREQVDQCLRDLIERLEVAVGQLGLVETLQAQLCEAQLEIDRLHRRQPQDPSWAPQLASIMAAAEQLRAQAAKEAHASGPTPSVPDTQADVEVDDAFRGETREQAYVS